MSRTTSRRPGKAKLGMAGYVKILAILRRQPCTTAEIQPLAGIGHTSAAALLPSFHLAGLAHIADWRQDYNCATMPVYAYGPGNDADMPAKRPTGKACNGARLSLRRVARPDVVALASVMRALSEPKTRQELHDETGLAATTIRLILRALKVSKLARVAEWLPKPGGGVPIEAYQLGSGADTPRPKAITKSEVARRYREAKRQRESMLTIIRATAGVANDNRITEAA